MLTLPRLVIAAPASGQGKTTVATGLMAALTARGKAVSGHKVGPDYIDPGYHALACGRPGRNLDPHLVGAERIVPLLLHGARDADVAVIEGVMGLFDGRIDGDGFSSTAHVATLTRSPVVLVVDIARASRTIGAVVHGLSTFDPDVRVAAVILNRAGSPRHAREVVSALRVPVLGVLGREQELALPSRHLGLVPAAEREQTDAWLARLTARITADVDLDAVLEVARTAPDLDACPWDPVAEVRPPVGGTGSRPVVATATGRAFTFAYAETAELLRAGGCDVVGFDPLEDPELPEGTAGIYLGGGFPEVHASGLHANGSLRSAVRDAVAAGVPVVAECAGLLYLCSSVDDVAMTGVLPATAQMSPRLTLGYRTAAAAGDSLLGRSGEEVTGHEFHRTRVLPAAGPDPAWTWSGQPEGHAGPSVHASYLHVHWAGHPHLAQRFVDAVHERHRSAGDPLRHHGDAEVRDAGLTDFAVNVFPGPRPRWLDAALLASLDDIDRYPHAGAAEAAVAARHGRPATEVLATAGAAEAFALIARARPWRHPVVVHPQFTEPHAALVQAGHRVDAIRSDATAGYRLPVAAVPAEADLVILGNPTNPTGVLHPAAEIRRLLAPGRLVVVDEAFIDAVPGEAESLSADRSPGLVVIRSLTKHWSIPGIRAGYLLGSGPDVARLRRLQSPWSVSAAAVAALSACSTEPAQVEAHRRAEALQGWRSELTAGLDRLGVEYVASAAPFVLARVGHGVHEALRSAGFAVRRADTFPGLGGDWVRIAVRPTQPTRLLLDALGPILGRVRPSSPMPLG